MWCYERKKEEERRKKEESRDKNSPKAFGELKKKKSLVQLAIKTHFSMAALAKPEIYVLSTR